MTTPKNARHAENRRRLVNETVAYIEARDPHLTGNTLARTTRINDRLWREAWQATGRTREPSEDTRGEVVALLSIGGGLTPNEVAAMNVVGF